MKWSVRRWKLKKKKKDREIWTDSASGQEKPKSESVQRGQAKKKEEVGVHEVPRSPFSSNFLRLKPEFGPLKGFRC